MFTQLHSNSTNSNLMNDFIGWRVRAAGKHQPYMNAPLEKVTDN